METFRLIGIMSGTSLDGIDIAYCKFTFDKTWSYKIEVAKTVTYSQNLKNRLKNLHNTSAIDLAQTHVDLGILFGNETKKFIEENHIDQINAISSHGHTVFHQPEKSLTFQIGSGAHIASITNLPTICDFRSKDVALGGQGAPLVPIGDELLFNSYDYCLNLGGIANVSFIEDKQRKSFDLGFANMANNYLANQLGYEFDKDGIIAQKGNPDSNLLRQLNDLPYFQELYPKSLGKEYFEEAFKPILDQSLTSTEDKLTTIAHHITHIISDFINKTGSGKVLITGGGAHNKFWKQLLREKTNGEIIIPDSLLIDYKEALIFAFLGALRLSNKNNCLASVTGAKSDSIGGCIYL